MLKMKGIIDTMRKQSVDCSATNVARLWKAARRGFVFLQFSIQQKPVLPDQCLAAFSLAGTSTSRAYDPAKEAFLFVPACEASATSHARRHYV